MLRYSLTYKASDLKTHITQLPGKLDKLVTATVERQRDLSTAQMKQTAPWTDRTSNARNSLHAVAFHSAGEHTLVLAHGMPYGIWLEVRFAGRYAVIYRSVVAGGQQIMNTLSRGMSRL